MKNPPKKIINKKVPKKRKKSFRKKAENLTLFSITTSLVLFVIGVVCLLRARYLLGIIFIVLGISNIYVPMNLPSDIIFYSNLYTCATVFMAISSSLVIHSLNFAAPKLAKKILKNS